MIFCKIRSILDRIVEGIKEAGGDDRGIGVVEVILILVGICIADKSRILCGNFRRKRAG